MPCIHRLSGLTQCVSFAQSVPFANANRKIASHAKITVDKGKAVSHSNISLSLM